MTTDHSVIIAILSRVLVSYLFPALSVLGDPNSKAEFGKECWCGLGLGSAQPYPNDCTTTCSGDSSQQCGAANRLTVYRVGARSEPTITQDVNGYSYTGCYTDDVNNRTLPRSQQVEKGPSANSAKACTQACFNNGYTLAGLEYSSGEEIPNSNT